MIVNSVSSRDCGVCLGVAARARGCAYLAVDEERVEPHARGDGHRQVPEGADDERRNGAAEGGRAHHLRRREP